MTTENNTSIVPPEVESRAKQMGWVPKEQFRGDDSKWVDAQEFVDRGENIIPIIKATNRRLEEQVGQYQGQLQQTQTQLRAALEAIEALKEVNSVSNLTKAKDTRRDLIVTKKKAEDEGNTELAIQLEEQISDQTAAIAEAEKAAKNKKKVVVEEEEPAAKVSDPTQTPDFRAWVSENPWWNVDEDRSGLAVVKGQQLRKDPANANLTQKQFMDKVSAEVERVLGPYQTTRTPSKTEGSRSNSTGGGSGAGGGGKKKKTFSDLPADAKAACNKLKNTLVGTQPGRAFKDAATYEQYYAEKYFEGEE